MNLNLIRSLFTVIKTEEEIRKSVPDDEEEVGLGYDEWQQEHWPVLNGMYLLVMVLIWHQLEKDLILMAARVGDPNSKMHREEYEQNRRELEKPKRRLEKLEGVLKLSTFPLWGSIDALREIVNCYKHDPYDRPSQNLLKALGLDQGANYRSLAESPALCEGFQKLLGLRENADYGDIAECYMGMAKIFLEQLRQATDLRPVQAGKASLSAKDAAI